MTEAPSGPRVARVAYASLRSSDKRLRATLRVATAPRREHRAHCELDKHPAKRFTDWVRAGRSSCSAAAAGAYLRFCLTMLNGGTLNGHRYLSPTGVKLMTSDHLGNRLASPVMAHVTEAVFDALSGQTLLVPQGTRLIGIYDSRVTHGQSLVLLVWTRLIMPNGRSIVLERLQGADIWRICWP
jgi:hypothetical protein